MIRRGLFTLALVALFILVGLPAVWMDALLARASHNELRLAQTEGSFWHGQGTLALPSADRRQWLPASRIEWRFSLRLAGLELTLREGTHPRLRLIAGVSGFRLEQLELDTPIAPLAAAVPHPLARAAWQGHLLATSPGLACRWNHECEGRLELQWHNASAAILPGRAFGSHRGILQAAGKRFDITLDTLEGQTRLDGHGTYWPAQNRLEIDATLQGDPDMVGRLPSIMNQHARRLAPDTIQIKVP